MTQQRHATDGWITRLRERRRAKRQQALEREYHDHERLDPSTRAYTDADNHARRWTSFFGGGGGGGGGG
jgi:hypothetical protein